MLTIVTYAAQYVLYTWGWSCLIPLPHPVMCRDESIMLFFLPIRFQAFLKKYTNYAFLIKIAVWTSHLQQGRYDIRLFFLTPRGFSGCCVSWFSSITSATRPTARRLRFTATALCVAGASQWLYLEHLHGTTPINVHYMNIVPVKFANYFRIMLHAFMDRLLRWHIRHIPSHELWWLWAYSWLVWSSNTIFLEAGEWLIRKLS